MTGEEMFKQDSDRSEKAAAKRKLVPTSELLAEYRKMKDDLDEMTGGHGDIAYVKANSARTAWRELRRRGIDPEGQT